LIKNTINDGSEGVIIPSNITGNKVRVKIAAADNIFLNISKKDAVVVNSAKVGYTVTASSEQYTVCLPDVAKINIQSSAFGGFNEKVKLSVVGGLPQGATSAFSKTEIAATESSELSIDMQKVTVQGLYNIKISAIAGKDTIFRTVTFNTIYANFDDLTLATPADGSTGNTTLPSFKWNPAAVADSYDFELATNPSFEANTIVFKKANLKPTDIPTPATLNENSVYFWRIKAKNTCRNGEYSTPFAFSTLIQTCKEYKKEDKLNTSNQNTVESTINVLESGKASDINIAGIKGYHDDFGDLIMSVVSPSGKVSTLFSKKCTTISPSFNMSFDDEAATGFNCSFLSGAPNFKPQTTLSVFDGEEIKGDWKLKIEDTKAGNGGNLSNWGVKFCFATSVTAPVLIKNDTLRVKSGFGRYIDVSTLAATDDKSDAGKITFTLVKSPENGFLNKWGTINMKVGDTFTQAELADGKILRYTDDGSKPSKYNSFLFIVTDGDGGFIGTYRYNIVRDEKAPTIGTTSIDVEKALTVYPNPTNQTLNVTWLGDSAEKIELGLYNIQGQNIENRTFKNGQFNTQFDVQYLPNGVYLLKVNTKEGVATKKIVVSH
jgi:subtilisin-like proprotein convertase family protein